MGMGKYIYIYTTVPNVPCVQNLNIDSSLCTNTLAHSHSMDAHTHTHTYQNKRKQNNNNNNNDDGYDGDSKNIQLASHPTSEAVSQPASHAVSMYSLCVIFFLLIFVVDDYRLAVALFEILLFPRFSCMRVCTCASECMCPAASSLPLFSVCIPF